MSDSLVDPHAPDDVASLLAAPDAALPGLPEVPDDEALTVCTDFDEHPCDEAEPAQGADARPAVPLLLPDRVRAAWDALTDVGEVPSVRKIYAQLGGSYNAVAAEVRLLRQVEGLPTALEETPEGPAALAVVAAEQALHAAEGQLQRLHATIAEAQQEVEDASAEVRDLERRALIPEDVAGVLKEARRRRWEARQRADDDLPALLPGCQQGVAEAHAALEAARLEVLHQQYALVTQGKAALYDTYQAALAALRDSLMALHDCTVEQRHLASGLGVAFPRDRSNPDRVIAWHLYTSLAEVAGLPPVRVSPSVRPVLAERLADADPSTQPLSAAALPALRQAGTPLRLAYRGGQVLGLREYGIERSLPEQRRAQEGVPCWYSAAEVERLRAHPAYTVVFEMIEDDVWPKDM